MRSETEASERPHVSEGDICKISLHFMRTKHDAKLKLRENNSSLSSRAQRAMDFISLNLDALLLLASKRALDLFFIVHGLLVNCSISGFERGGSCFLYSITCVVGVGSLDVFDCDLQSINPSASRESNLSVGLTLASSSGDSTGDWSAFDGVG